MFLSAFLPLAFAQGEEGSCEALDALGLRLLQLHHAGEAIDAREILDNFPSFAETVAPLDDARDEFERRDLVMAASNQLAAQQERLLTANLCLQASTLLGEYDFELEAFPIRVELGEWARALDVGAFPLQGIWLYRVAPDEGRAFLQALGGEADGSRIDRRVHVTVDVSVDYEPGGEVRLVPTAVSFQTNDGVLFVADPPEAPAPAEATGAAAPKAVDAVNRRVYPRAAVVVDNGPVVTPVGLWAASILIEAPAPGGDTVLLAIYERGTPTRIGPVGTAEDYLVHLAAAHHAALVMTDASPGASIAIGALETPVITPADHPSAFTTEMGRQYAYGPGITQAVDTLTPSQERIITTPVWRTEGSDGAGTGYTLPYSAFYASGAIYDDQLEAYQWVRDGTPVLTEDRSPLTFDATLVARVTARLIPGDLEGRLYIPLDGGEADLFLHEARFPGTWALNDHGLEFTTSDGNVINLSAYRTLIQLFPRAPTLTSD